MIHDCATMTVTISCDVILDSHSTLKNERKNKRKKNKVYSLQP